MYLRKGKHAQYKPKSDTSSTTVRDAAVVPQTDSELVYLTQLLHVYFFKLKSDNEI